MKAVRIHEHGDVSVLRYEDAPIPELGPADLLVRVHAAGVNPVDWKFRTGAFRMPGAAFPATLGFDVSGVIERVGPQVTKFKPGDEVYAYLNLQKGGGYAQFAAVAESEAALKPRSIDHIHAGATPLAALTAWQALIDTAGLRADQTVLIHAAAGGVGHFAVQIAKAKGARVVATASERNHAFLKDLGADVVVDYRTQRFEDFAKNVDVVLDAVGGDTQARSYAVLKPGGILVSIVQPPNQARLDEHNIRGAVILVKPAGSQLVLIAEMIDAGQIKPHVSATFPLEQAADAQRAVETGSTRGKIVLTVP
ncbi:MAG: NADP-dependent oxidoreductase [Phycisphaerales bacterium]|nr:NADP-dependent oxidoreductase [Phycisphaerales bacterium]